MHPLGNGIKVYLHKLFQTCFFFLYLLGVALQNSPSGFVAYMLDRYSFSTNPNWLHKENGGILPTYDLDFLLDNIMIYWVTNSITTSMRLYAETNNWKSQQPFLDR